MFSFVKYSLSRQVGIYIRASVPRAARKTRVCLFTPHLRARLPRCGIFDAENTPLKHAFETPLMHNMLPLLHKVLSPRKLKIPILCIGKFQIFDSREVKMPEINT